MVQPIGDLV